MALRPACTGFAVVLAMLAALTGRSGAMSCTEAAAVAEAGAGVPAGLLLAIGVVESGRTDAAGMRAPWPFAIQSGGVGRFPASAEDAVAAVQALQAGGVQSIDVGCFQINLLHHPNAFPNLASGFDPMANALAAARFLASLREELGAWEPAVAAYHSRTEALGTPYRDMVLAAWHGTPAPAAAIRTVASIRVWGPAGEINVAASPGPLLVSMVVPMPRTWVRMPRIVTASAR
jgi:hypothetical protein